MQKRLKDLGEEVSDAEDGEGDDDDDEEAEGEGDGDDEGDSGADGKVE